MAYAGRDVGNVVDAGCGHGVVPFLCWLLTVLEDAAHAFNHVACQPRAIPDLACKLPLNIVLLAHVHGYRQEILHGTPSSRVEHHGCMTAMKAAKALMTTVAMDRDDDPGDSDSDEDDECDDD